MIEFINNAHFLHVWTLSMVTVLTEIHILVRFHLPILKPLSLLVAVSSRPSLARSPVPSGYIFEQLLSDDDVSIFSAGYTVQNATFLLISICWPSTVIFHIKFNLIVRYTNFSIIYALLCSKRKNKYMYVGVHVHVHVRVLYVCTRIRVCDVAMHGLR